MSDDSYILHTYFPSSQLREIEEEKRLRAPSVLVSDNQKKQIIAYLKTKECSELHLLGSTYYNAELFTNHQDLFAAFLELPKKTSVYFLTEEISRDVKFLEALIRNSILRSNRSAAAQSRAFLAVLGDYAIKRIEERQKVVDSLPESCKSLQSFGICPAGLEDAKDTDTDAGPCCTLKPDFEKSKPLAKNDVNEEKILIALKDALLSIITLNAYRKLFEHDYEASFEADSCRDSTWAESARSSALSVQGKLKQVAQATFHKSPGTRRSSRSACSAHANNKTILTKFNEFFTTIRKQIESISTRLVLMHIKKLLLKTVCSYILQHDLFKDIEGPTSPLPQNHRQGFSQASRAAYLKNKDVVKTDVRENLYRIFLAEFAEDESTYVTLFMSSIQTAAELLEDVSLGFTKFLFDTATRASYEVISDAFKTVFFNFLYTDTLQAGSDIFENIITIFDVSEELCRRPLALKKYPDLKKWRPYILSQILGKRVNFFEESQGSKSKGEAISSMKAAQLALTFFTTLEQRRLERPFETNLDEFLSKGVVPEERE